MDRLSALEMFFHSHEQGSFSAAARQLGISPAAVSKQVSRLERELGVQLVRRNTRSLALTEAGERLVAEALPGLQQLQSALAGAQQQEGEVSGLLRVTIAPGFGKRYVLPHVGPLMAAHPALRIDWHFENRSADLVAEGFDVGIAGAVDLSGGLVARTLAPLHLVLVAAPAYLDRRGAPRGLDDLAAHDLLSLRSPASGRVRAWQLRSGRQLRELLPSCRMTINDPESVCEAAAAGHGIGLVGLAHAADLLEDGRLLRVLPAWHADVGHITVYYPPTRLMPRKSRVFVDHVVELARRDAWSRRLDARRWTGD